MPFKDLFKNLNCCAGSGIAIDDPSNHDQDDRDQQTMPVTMPAQSFDRAQSSTSLERKDGRNSSGQAVHLFPNAQGFSIQNSNLNTSVHYTDPLQDALGLLLANSAPSATYNSKDRSFDTPRCDEDTRVGLVEEIMNWAESDEVPSKLLCMTGSAGSGKSALAQTISETCVKKGCFGASFFFSAADPRRNNPDRLICSLAYQISQCMDGVKMNICQALKNDPAIFEMSMERQAKVLLIDPTLKAMPTSERPWVIVVDGLDECREEQHQAQVLEVLHTCAERGLPFRIFITSRPEYAIRSALKPTGHLNGLYHIILNEHDTTEDIRLYLRRRLREIGRAKGDNDWPSEDLLEILVEGASRQFIYAATVVKFVGDRRRPRKRSLQIVIDCIRSSSGKRNQNPFAALDDLYTNILTTAQAAYEESGPIIHHLMTLILLHDVYIIEHPRSGAVDSRAVEHLLGWEDDECDRILEDLHSVIYVRRFTGKEFHGLGISFYHKSFLDYLLDSSRCQTLYISPDAVFVQLTIITLNHVIATKADSSRTRAVLALGLSGRKALENRSIELNSLALALLAWPHFLPLALMVHPDDPIHDEVCEAVARLSEGGWHKLTRPESGFARNSGGLQLLQHSSPIDRDCRHSTLALCKSVPLPGSLRLRSFEPRTNHHPVLLYPLRDQLERRSSTQAP